METKTKMILMIVIAVIMGSLGAAFLFFSKTLQFAGIVCLAPAFSAVNAARKYKKKL